MFSGLFGFKFLVAFFFVAQKARDFAVEFLKLERLKARVTLSFKSDPPLKYLDCPLVEVLVKLNPVPSF